jgi:thiamine-phosphate pyrophosphorylase
MADRCLLYYITDRTAFTDDEPTRRRRLLQKIAEAARAGVDYIQLREKDLPTRKLESLAQEVVNVLRQLSMENRKLRSRLLINSRTDIALAIGADGLHLRSDDVPPQEVRRIWRLCGADTLVQASTNIPLIAVSCHSPAEVAEAASDGASFAVFAPVFEKKEVPRTKPGGLVQLREACKEGIPVLALGGVTLENAKSCLDAGAAGIAAIRLFQENDVAKIADSLRQPDR